MLDELLKRDNIIISNLTTKESALELLIDKAFASGHIADREELSDKVMHREELMSTGIGYGIALPHVRYEGVAEPIMVAGIFPKGLADYGTVDEHPIKIVLLVVLKADQHRLHIKILSEVVAKLRDETLREYIISAEKPERIHKLLTEN